MLKYNTTHTNTLYLPNLLQLIPLPPQHIPPLLNLPKSLPLRLPNFLQHTRAHNPRLNIHPFLSPLLHLPTHALLNRQHKLHIALPNQRHRITAPARTRRPSNTVHVVIRIARDVEVDDQRDGGDIETTRGDVRGDEDAGCGRAEAGEVGGSLGLREETVQGCDAVGETAEGAFEEVGGVGAVAEDDGWFGGVDFGGEEDVEEGFAVGHGDFEVGLVEGWGDGAFCFCGDFCHEDGWFVGGSGHGLQHAHFGGDRRGE